MPEHRAVRQIGRRVRGNVQPPDGEPLPVERGPKPPREREDGVPFRHGQVQYSSCADGTTRPSSAVNHARISAITSFG